MLRRLEKRILVDLPGREARRAMLEHHLPPVINSSTEDSLEIKTEIDYEGLADVRNRLFPLFGAPDGWGGGGWGDRMG